MSILSVALFVFFVAAVLALSFYFAGRAKSASGYYAAGSRIHWGVNGIAFAGDYLSAASFLGICGMIATAGYDGFLYSIGYLAGWVVALFVVAEPMKRLGKYTFTDALDARYNHRGIKLTAAISTLVVSLFYLIPQMVGAGVLVTPLLGLPHFVGVILVGAIVITIVATAGMTSTTYVQFIKGALLIIFSSLDRHFLVGTRHQPHHTGTRLPQVPDPVDVAERPRNGSRRRSRYRFSPRSRRREGIISSNWTRRDGVWIEGRREGAPRRELETNTVRGEYRHRRHGCNNGEPIRRGSPPGGHMS
jgi:Na+(H+)/acetate symporter ActP